MIDPRNVRLKDVMASCGGLIGTQAERRVLDQNSALSAYIRENVSILTPGNDMKWSVLRPSADSFQFGNADWVVNFCQKNGIAVHGHNLAWNSENPSWLNAPMGRAQGIELLTKHIQTVVGRYRGKIDSWDVVNEPVAVWNNRPDGLRNGPWISSIGPDYIDIAFHATAQTDPGALRVLNLNHVEQAEKDIQLSRQKVLELLRGMLSRRVPVQAVGLESHLSLGKTDKGPLLAFLNAIKQMGLQVLITELDITDNSAPGDFAQRDAAVAAEYADYLSFMIANVNPKRIIFWSLNDRGNWLDQMPSLRRSDNLTHRPGLLDPDLVPKAAFTSVIQALQGCRK